MISKKPSHGIVQYFVNIVNIGNYLQPPAETLRPCLGLASVLGAVLVPGGQ